MWIHVNDPLDKSAYEQLQEQLKDHKVTSEHFDKDILKEKVADVDVLVVRSATKVTREIIEAGKNLKIIGRAGMGLDNIDMEAAKEKNLVVVNTPGQNSLSVAELVVGMILDIYRGISRGTIGIKNGKWEKKKLTGLELSNKTLGIIGFGYIGKYIADLVRGFNVNVVAFDVTDIPEEDLKKHNAKQVTLEELYKTSDIITLHVPSNKHTHHMISDEQFEMMKDNVVIINAARGGVINEEALLKYLENGKIYGVGLDVFETEPPTGEFYEKLLSHERLVATPHIGASTEEAQERVGFNIVERVVNEIKKV
jgi:D-3-phosphoglycerate dehydrogenase